MFEKIEILIIVFILLLTFYLVITLAAGKKRKGYLPPEIKNYLFGSPYFNSYYWGRCYDFMVFFIKINYHPHTTYYWLLNFFHISQSISSKYPAKRGASNTGDCKAFWRNSILILESSLRLDENFWAIEIYSF